MSIDNHQIGDLIGRPVHTSDGHTLGDVGQVYLDDITGMPEWVTVKTGVFGTKQSFVPVGAADFAADGLRVPYDKGTVKDAPLVEPEDGHLSVDEERELFRHYGIDDTDTDTDTDTDDTERRDRSAERGVVGHDTSGPTTDDAMTRSEERLDVGTQTREAGRVRLRKHEVTEEQTVTVPVSREKVVLEREAVTDANLDSAMAGPEISEEEHEVVLHEEVPVVGKKAVPVERVRLGKEAVTDAEEVTDSVRKEQIDLDDASAELPAVAGQAREREDRA